MITEVVIVLFYCIFSCDSKKTTIVKREEFLQYDAPNFGNNMEFPNQIEGVHARTHFEAKTNIPMEPSQELINEDDQSNEIPIGPLESLEGPKVEGNVRLKDLLTFIRKTNIPENPYETLPQQIQDQNKYNTDLDNSQPQNLLEMLAKKNFITQEKQWPASGRFQNIPTYFQNGIAPVKKEEIPHTKEMKESLKEVIVNKKDAMEESEDSEMKDSYEAIYGRSKNAPYYGAQMVKKSAVPKLRNEEEFRPFRKDKSNEESDSINLVTRETKSTDILQNSSLSNYGQLVISEIMAPLNLSGTANTTAQIINSTLKNIPEVSTENVFLLNNTNVLSNTSTNATLNNITPLNIGNLNVIPPLNNALYNTTIKEQTGLTSHIQELKKPLTSTYVTENTAITTNIANAGYTNILQYETNKIPFQYNNKKITSDNQINKISKIETISDPYENFRRTVIKPSNQITALNNQATTAISQIATTSNQESTPTYQDGHNIQNGQYQILGNRGFVMKYEERPIEKNQEIYANYLTHQTFNPQYKKTDITDLTVQHQQEKARKVNIPNENQKMGSYVSNEKKFSVNNYKDYNWERIKKTIIKNTDPNEHLRDISAWKLIEELNKMKKSTIPQMLNVNRAASQQSKKTDIKRAPYSDSYPLVLNKYPLEGHVYKKVSNDVFKKSGIPLPVAHVDSFPLVLRMRPAEGSLTREHITAKQNTLNRKQLIGKNQNAPVTNTFFAQKWNNNRGGNNFIPIYSSFKKNQNGMMQDPRYGVNFYYKQKKSEILNKEDKEKNNLKNYNLKRSRIQYPEQLELNSPTQNLYQTKNEGSTGQMFTQSNEVYQPDDNNKFQTSDQERNTQTNNDQEYNLIKTQIMNNDIDHLTSTPIGDDGFQTQFQQFSRNSDEAPKNLENYMAPNNPQSENYQNAQDENSISENQKEAAREMLQKRGQIPRPPSYFHPQSGKIESYPLLLRRYPAEGSLNLRGRSIITTFNNTEENPIYNNNYRD
ncbi:uncharacterized protein LOC101237889 isoform X1 [Hydra vulgaris]|uniref:uncharacterized protein LOC101237889 isoform X1 n=1 Tax=Hydra vulgaris TaxID=6087 RepID=UPI0032EA5BA4